MRKNSLCPRGAETLRSSQPASLGVFIGATWLAVLALANAAGAFDESARHWTAPYNIVCDTPGRTVVECVYRGGKIVKLEVSCSAFQPSAVQGRVPSCARSR